MNQKLVACLFGLTLAGLCVATSGCATIVRGTKDTLVVESDPAGATVTLSTGQTGKTPTSFKLPRKHDLVVTIAREGYETLTINVTAQVSGAGAAGMAGNVLIGGLVGAVVDPLTGAMKDLRPNPVRANLVPLKKVNAIAAAAAPTSPAAPIAVSPAVPAQPLQPAATASPAVETTPPAPASSPKQAPGTEANKA